MIGREGAGTGGSEFSALLERLTLWQLCGFVILASWMMGGNIWWADFPLRMWGTLGGLIFVASLILRIFRRGDYGYLAWLVTPLVLFNLLVIVGCLNPNHREMAMAGQQYFMRGGDISWLPSSACPRISLQSLWLFDGIYLSCMNLFLNIRSRQQIMHLLTVCAVNGLLLSVFGTLQKFSGSDGPYWGAVKAPNIFFFSTFLYHNHWGPFILLTGGTCIGVVWHYARKGFDRYRDFWHSPGFLYLTAAFFLFASIPLSGSRSCTILSLVIAAEACVRWIFTQVKNSAGGIPAIRLRLGVSACIIILASAAIAWNAYPALSLRWKQTVAQTTELTTEGRVADVRSVLYKDVVTMAKERPLFGWGMASFPIAFFGYNTQFNVNARRPGFFFEDAHSDWLQSFAEHGIIGSMILLLMAGTPLYTARTFLRRNLPSKYMLAACAIILVQALIEFPFGCPAVVLVWWICFFSSLRLAKLESLK